MVDRRSFLRMGAVGVGGLSFGGLLAACSSADAGPPPQLVSLFSPDRVIVAGRTQRLPFGIVDPSDSLTADDLEVTVRVRQLDTVIDESTASSRIVTHDHPDGNGEADHEHSDLQRYFAVRTTLPEPGIYDLDVDIQGTVVSLAVQAFAESDVGVLLPDDPFPPLVTPTEADPLGLEQLCTRLPETCSFHERTAAEILAAGEPMALLVATPSLCFTAYCGPVLDTLIELAPKYPSIAMVHLEVYENPESVGFDYRSPDIRVVQAVADLGLEFEPSLFLVDRNGIVAERIDNVFDNAELDTALAAIA